MATGNMLLGLSRKKLGDIVFYRSDGQQRARVRVRVIKNPRSAKQAVQRMVLATASKTLAALRGLYNHSFENVAVGTPSLRYAQRLLMEGYRARAATVINGGQEFEKAMFAIKGAPIAGCYEGMPLTKGRLSFNNITEGADGPALDLTAELAQSISTQAQYVAELAKLGIEPGDQLTFVVYAVDTSKPVAQFGSEENFADMYRYARITFKTELPDGFEGALNVAGAFNSALIEKSEGIMPSVTAAGASLLISFDNVLGEVPWYGFTIVRSKKLENGTTQYNPAVFMVNSTDWDYNNAVNVYPSYMTTEEAINVGDTLYLKNAEAAPFA